MNPFGDTLKYGTEIAMALMSVAVIGLILTNSQGFKTSAGTVFKGFGGLLSVATFQTNNFANVFNGL